MNSTIAGLVGMSRRKLSAQVRISCSMRENNDYLRNRFIRDFDWMGHEGLFFDRYIDYLLEFELFSFNLILLNLDFAYLVQYGCLI